MYAGKRQIFDWVFVLYVVDFWAIAIAVVVSPELYNWFGWWSDQLTGAHTATWGARFVYVAFLLHSMGRFPLYTWSTFMNKVKELKVLMYTVMLTTVVTTVFLYAVRYVELLIFHWVILQTFVTLTCMLSGRLLAWFLMVKLFDLIPRERIAFVGWSPRLERVIPSLQREMKQFQTVLGFFETKNSDEDVTEAEQRGYKSLGGLQDIEKVNEEKEITLLVIDEGTLTGDQLREVGAACSRLIINFRLIPSAFDILGRRLMTRVMAGVPVLGIQGVRMDLFHNRLAKRCVDIVGALVGLTLSIPIISICGFLIYRESPGSIFYEQERLGQRGKLFKMVKLRTMRLDAEKAGPGWTVANDPRRLRVGGALRKWNLDEVPQFWNVLKGEMSLVGPRPERPNYVDQFSKDYRHYNLRHYCKPGMTSWAAVHGLRGDTSLTDRLEYDLYYLENWSLVLDFKIMLMTLRRPKNAY